MIAQKRHIQIEQTVFSRGTIIGEKMKKKIVFEISTVNDFKVYDHFPLKSRTKYAY